MQFDWMRLLDSFLLALIEGVSEFLPVSSTGHMIIYDELFAFSHPSDRVTFMVVIQAGAIAAIVHIYFMRLYGWLCAFGSTIPLFGLKQEGERSHLKEYSRNAKIFLFKLAAAVIPFAIVGLLFKNEVKSLFSAKSVGFALIAGGFLLVADDLRSRRQPHQKDQNIENVSWFDCLFVGICQCCALWPGFSRSAASILGARLRGYSPKSATELSFLIGLPTIGGTAFYEFLSQFSKLDAASLGWLLFGVLVAWFSAFVSVRWFLKIVSKGGLLYFGVYRILVGALLLAYL